MVNSYVLGLGEPVMNQDRSQGVYENEDEQPPPSGGAEETAAGLTRHLLGLSSGWSLTRVKQSWPTNRVSRGCLLSRMAHMLEV